MDADIYRTFRASRGMSRRDLARVIGVHPSTIKNIESGRFRPSLGTQQKFAALTARHESQGMHDAH